VIGGSTRQSQMRLPNSLTSRSEGRGQGRPQPAFIVRESLRACRSEGSSCDRLGLIQLATRVRFDGGNSTYLMNWTALRRAPTPKSYAAS
jgi:hypothetical protein